MNTIQIDLMNRVRGRLQEAAAGVYSQQVARRMQEGRAFTRDPEAEKIILQDWRFAYLYSREFIRGRWHAFEDAIADAPASTDQAEIRCVYNYARYIRGARMPSAEKHIANDAESAVDYAQNVLGGNWDSSLEDSDLANTTIAAHPTAASAYRLGM